MELLDSEMTNFKASKSLPAALSVELHSLAIAISSSRYSVLVPVTSQSFLL